MIVVDTSAIIAIIQAEPESAAFLDHVRRADRALMSAVSVLEAGMAAGVFAPGNPKLLAFALFGAVNWIPRWYNPDGAASSQEIAELFADFFVAGLRRT